MSTVAPLLVLGWGNRSRGADALGPTFVEALMRRLGSGPDPALSTLVEGLDDYQLQVEHALDLVGRRHVLFVDASLTAVAPFEAGRISAERDASALPEVQDDFPFDRFRFQIKNADPGITAFSADPADHQLAILNNRSPVFIPTPAGVVHEGG